MTPEHNQNQQPGHEADGQPFMQKAAQPLYSADSAPVTNDPGPSSLSSVPSAPRSLPGGHRWSEILSTILLLTLAPAVALLIILFAIQSYQVDGQSMQPTLENRDRLIVNKIPRTLARITGHKYLPHRGDIIIFNESNLPDTLPGQDKQLIKRVIGLPGDHVVVKNSKITIYNKTDPGGFNPDVSVGYHIAATSTPGDHEWDVQTNQLFVCGDNRPNSEDSRFFGPIEAQQIVGKLVLRLLPLNKTQRF